MKNILRSAVFMGCFVSSCQFTWCHVKNYRRKMDKWSLLISSFVCSFALLIEPSSRASEIGMFVLPRALESIFKLLKANGFIKPVKYGTEIVFACCLALLMYCYENRPELIKKSYLAFFRQFFGKN